MTSNKSKNFSKNCTDMEEANYTMSSTINDSELSTVTTENDLYHNYRGHIEYIQVCLFAIVIWTGLICNSLAIICFITSKPLRRTTTGYYLIALTSADTVFLIGDMLRWLNSIKQHEPVFGLTFIDDSNFWCKIIYFLRYFGKLVSAWITVTITFERYISIKYPLKAARLSTKTYAIIIIVLTYCGCAILTMFPFWTIGLQLYDQDNYTFTYCTFIDIEKYNHWNWVINRVLSLIIPSIVLFVVTALIVYKLHQISKRRKSMSLSNNNTTQHLERQLTLMLIAVSVSFLLLRLPYTISYYLFYYQAQIWTSSSLKRNIHLWTAVKFTDVMASLNYAVNFFLYCLAGSTFRSNFIALLLCQQQREIRRKKTVSSHNTLSTSMRSLHKISPAVSMHSLCKLTPTANKKKLSISIIENKLKDEKF